MSKKRPGSGPKKVLSRSNLNLVAPGSKPKANLNISHSRKIDVVDMKRIKPVAKKAPHRPEENKMIDVGLDNVIAKFAHTTRKGFIPGKPDKQNQDQYFCCENFANIRNNWFFSVCDGHGINGHFASDHIKQFLPANIELLDKMAMKQKREEQEKQASNPDSDNKFFNEDEDQDAPSYLVSKDRRRKYAVISEGFIKTSMDLRRRSFDVNYSGSTVVSVMFTGKSLICANVGDSRAVLGSLRSIEEADLITSHQNSEFQIETKACDYGDGKNVWMSTSLSIDHKPDRKDEYERIMRNIGRVDPFREPDGEPIGPARVWLKEENVPGLAMSRSVGDLVAASVGVIPEPGKICF